jgi:hypothetical protein
VDGIFGGKLNTGLSLEKRHSTSRRRHFNRKMEKKKKKNYVNVTRGKYICVVLKIGNFGK